MTPELLDLKVWARFFGDSRVSEAGRHGYMEHFKGFEGQELVLEV